MIVRDLSLVLTRILTACDEEDCSMLKRLTSPNKKLFYLVTEDWAFVSHRIPTAKAAQDAGFEVSVLTSVKNSREQIVREGFNLIPIEWSRNSLNPVNLIKNILQIRQIYKKEKPDIVHHIAVKPILIGGISALGIPVLVKFNSVIGLGALTALNDFKIKTIMIFVQLVLRFLLRRSRTYTLFQNLDDQKLLQKRCGLPKENMYIVPGSGVDTDKFAPIDTIQNDVVTFSVVSRMLKIKGIEEVVEASDILQSRGVEHKVRLVGQIDPGNPSSLTTEQLEIWSQKPQIEWLGHQTDISLIWARSDVAVLASRGGEGVPKCLLEAASCSKPLVSTNVPGCKDITVDNVTGVLIEPRNPEFLAEAMERFCIEPGLCQSMGKNARQLVLKKFDAQIIRKQMRNIYAGLFKEHSPKGYLLDNQ